MLWLEPMSEEMKSRALIGMDHILAHSKYSINIHCMNEWAHISYKGRWHTIFSASFKNAADQHVKVGTRKSRKQQQTNKMKSGDSQNIKVRYSRQSVKNPKVLQRNVGTSKLIAG